MAAKTRRVSRAKSSEHIHSRRKTWLSLRDQLNGKGEDISARSGLPWWKSPMMREARLAKAATLRKR